MATRNSKMHIRLVAAIAAAMAVFIAACSNSGAATLDEYVAWCAEFRTNNEISEIGSQISEIGSNTWGDYTSALENLLGEVRSIDPPQEVAEYHAGFIAAIQALLAVAQQEDENEISNPFALLGAGLLLVGIVEEAEQSLSPSTRAALEEGGCLDPGDGDDTSTNDGGGQVDRSEIAAIGDRITVERSRSEDRFEMIVRGRPRRIGDVYSVPVTVVAISDEWTYEDNAWTDEQIELVSEPDANGRIYKLIETTQFWDRPVGSLEGVILVIGGKHDGALYFPAGDAPPGTQFVELRYPVGDTRRVVDLSR